MLADGRYPLPHAGNLHLARFVWLGTSFRELDDSTDVRDRALARQGQDSIRRANARRHAFGDERIAICERYSEGAGLNDTARIAQSLASTCATPPRFFQHCAQLENSRRWSGKMPSLCCRQILLLLWAGSTVLLPCFDPTDRDGPPNW
jgi:hypothetical protein